MILDKNTKTFLTILFLIAIIGIVMVYSSSYIYAKENFGSSLHFVLRQFIYYFLGIGCAFVVAKTKASFWYKNGFFFHVVCGLLICLTFTPLGVTIKGASRWINIMGFNFQPGEFVKITSLLASLHFFEKFEEFDFKEVMLKIVLLFFPLVMVLIQPDFGTFTIAFIMMMFAAFMSRFRRSYFIAILTAGVISVAGILVSAPYRIKRLMTFLDPWSDPQNSGFQIIQSYLAFANGHIFGQGIGNSTEKLFYLPEAYNDFILSVIGEEIGFVGIFVIVLLFVAFIYYGLKISLTQQSRMNVILMSSMIFLIGIQAFMNMGVVLGLLPTKGLNLPFISYGGSSLISNMIALGFFLSCANKKSIIEDDDVKKEDYRAYGY